MGKFFNGRVRNDRGTLIKYAVIAGGVALILLFLIIIVANNRGGEVVLTVKPKIEIEVGSEMPEKMDFFTDFQNFSEDNVTINYNGADTNIVGTYYVRIDAKGRDSVTVELNVVDTKAPTLTVKNVNIEEGKSYAAEDFVASCEDNYDKACTIEYYTGSVDEEGNVLNYGSYVQKGTYPIMIVAKDISGNTTEPKKATLTIGDGQSEVNPDCNYGDLKLGSDVTYPVAVIVGNEAANCAVNRDLYDKTEVQKPVNDFYKLDYERLKVELDDILKKEYPNGAKIVAYPHYIAALNEAKTGLVGYGLYVKVYVSDVNSTDSIDDDKNLKLAYYLNSDKTREYEVNAFNLQK